MSWKPVGSAGLVFVFMAVLTAHAQFRLFDAGSPGIGLRGLEALRAAISGILGPGPTVGLFALLTLILPALAYRRAVSAPLQDPAVSPRALDPPQLAPISLRAPDVGSAEPTPPRRAVRPGVLDRGRTECLAFKHVFPPRLPYASLTYLGGLPFAPPDFSWPAALTAKGELEPLTFMGQIDCSALPHGGLRPLLPADGVLYFFTGAGDCELKGLSEVAVQYAAGPRTGAWAEARPPRNLAPIGGWSEAPHRYPWISIRADAPARYPRAHPRIELQAGWMPSPDAPPDLEGPALERFRRDQRRAMTDFHGDPLEADPLFSSTGRPRDPLWRPYPEFPQTWRAVATVAGSVRAFCASQSKRGRGDPEVLKTIDQGAEPWTRRAAEQPPLAEPSPAEREGFWDWLDALHAGRVAAGEKPYGRGSILGEITPWLTKAAINSAEALLARSGETASRVPVRVVQALRERHAVLRQHMFKDGWFHQHQMFGRGRSIQSAADEMGEDHLLLLQLGPDNGTDWEMGDNGAYQYWIRPEDLAALRFDKVVLTFECH